jgi:hypothetical protein
VGQHLSFAQIGKATKGVRPRSEPDSGRLPGGDVDDLVDLMNGKNRSIKSKEALSRTFALRLPSDPSSRRPCLRLVLLLVFINEHLKVLVEGTSTP